jgi:hypothetical protein
VELGVVNQLTGSDRDGYRGKVTPCFTTDNRAPAIQFPGMTARQIRGKRHFKFNPQTHGQGMTHLSTNTNVGDVVGCAPRSPNIAPHRFPLHADGDGCDHPRAGTSTAFPIIRQAHVTANSSSATSLLEPPGRSGVGARQLCGSLPYVLARSMDGVLCGMDNGGMRSSKFTLSTERTCCWNDWFHHTRRRHGGDCEPHRMVQCLHPPLC